MSLIWQTFSLCLLTFHLEKYVCVSKSSLRIIALKSSCFPSLGRTWRCWRLSPPLQFPSSPSFLQITWNPLLFAGQHILDLATSFNTRLVLFSPLSSFFFFLRHCVEEWDKRGKLPAEFRIHYAFSEETTGMYAIKTLFLHPTSLQLSEKQHILQDLTYIHGIICNTYVAKAHEESEHLAKLPGPKPSGSNWEMNQKQIPATDDRTAWKLITAG